MTAQPRIAVVDADEVTTEIAAMRSEMARMNRMLADLVKGPQKDWLTVSEYAEFIGKSKATVHRKARSGEIETRRMGGVLMVKKGE